MRTAMIGGGAYAMGKHRQAGQTEAANAEQDQDQRISELEQQQAPPAAASGGDMVSQLKELSALKDAGALTDAEFEAAKQKLLAG